MTDQDWATTDEHAPDPQAATAGGWSTTGDQAPTPPNVIPMESMSHKYGITNPWLAKPLDFLEEVGAAPSSTLHGITTLANRVAPFIPVTPEVKVTDSTAGGWGKSAEQAVEYMLPAGKAAQAEKFGVETASKLPGVLAPIGRTVARFGTQAVPAGAVALAQTADPETAKSTALISGAIGALSPVIRAGITRVLGAATGTGTAAMEAAVKGAPELTQAMRGDISEGQVLENARAALQNIKDARGAAYRTEMAKVAANKQQLNTTPVWQNMLQSLQRYRIGYATNPQTGQLMLDFGGSVIGEPGAQEEVRRVANDVWDWGTRPNTDNTPLGLDALKQRIDQQFTKDSRARAFVQEMKGQVRDILNKVPNYQKMTESYARASDLLDNLGDLSLESKNDGTAIRKLTTVLNQNYEFRRELLDSLSRYSATGDIGAQVAGRQLSRWEPRGIRKAFWSTAGMGELAGLFTGKIPLTPEVVAGLLVTNSLSSPRITGEALRAAGRYAPQLKTIPGMLYVKSKHPDAGYAGGGKVGYDDGGDVDTDGDGTALDVLRDIVRRQTTPQSRAQQVRQLAPPRPAMGPPQAQSQPITNIPSDHAGLGLPDVNPMPEWYQRADAAINQPFSMQVTGGAPMSLSDMVNIPQNKWEAGLLAAGALVPGSKALSAGKKALQLGTTALEGAAPEAGILSKAINAEGRTVRGGLDAAGNYVPAPADVQKLVPKLYEGYSGRGMTDVPETPRIQAADENFRARAFREANQQLSWKNWDRPQLESDYGPLVPSKFNDPKRVRLQNTPEAVQKRIQDARDFLRQPVEEWVPPDYGIFDRSLIKDAMEGFPGVEQTQYPRTVAPKADLSHVTQTYENPVNQELIRLAVERGRKLKGDLFYPSVYPLKVAAMEAGIPEETFNQWIYGISPSSAKNSVMAENTGGNLLYRMYRQGIPLTKENLEVAKANFRQKYGVSPSLMETHLGPTAKVLEQGILPPDVIRQNLTDRYKIPTYAIGKAGDFKNYFVGDVHESRGTTLASPYHPYFAEQEGFGGNEYGPMENYMRDLARSMDMATGPMQGARWHGAGQLTGLKSEPGDWLNTIEKQAAYTMHGQGMPTQPRDVRNYILNLIRQGGELVPYSKKALMPDYREFAPTSSRRMQNP